jgi:hypothetical protein
VKLAAGLAASVVLLLAPGAGAAGAHAGKAPAPARFSGKDAKLLPPLRFPHAVVLRWHESGKSFVVVGIQAPKQFKRLPHLVASKAKSGSRALPPGTYRFKVVTSGSWSLTVG